MPVDRLSMIPLHIQIFNILKEEIHQGVYKERIPAEFELMERFAVSRSTVRRAIQSLVDEGILEKKHGVGTFIVLRPVEEWLGNMTSYFESVKNTGRRAHVKLLKQGFAADEKDVQRTLGVQKYFYVCRLWYADHVPAALDKHYYSAAIGEKLNRYDLGSASAYRVLEKQLGLALIHAKQLITVTVPAADEKAWLGLPEETLCALMSERLVYDSGERILEYEKTIYRTDMHSFHIHLSRKRTL